MVPERTHTQLLLDNLVEELEVCPVRQRKLRLDEETRLWLAKQKQRIASRKSKLKHRDERLAKNRTPEMRARYASYQRNYRSGLTDDEKRKLYLDHRRWCSENKERRKEHNRKSTAKPERKAKRNERARRKRKIDGDKIRAYFRNYLPKWKEKQRRENPQFLIKDRMRSCLKRGLRAQGLQKTASTEEMVGCTMTELRAHLESQFVNGMHWGDPSLSIDHIVAVAHFDLRDDEERRWAFNWRNLQPLELHANKSKHTTLPNPLPSFLPAHIAARILSRTQRRPELALEPPSPHP